jgi:hypothetical protein
MYRIKGPWDVLNEVKRIAAVAIDAPPPSAHPT